MYFYLKMGEKKETFVLDNNNIKEKPFIWFKAKDKGVERGFLGVKASELKYRLKNMIFIKDVVYYYVQVSGSLINSLGENYEIYNRRRISSHFALCSRSFEKRSKACFEPFRNNEPLLSDPVFA